MNKKLIAGLVAVALLAAVVGGFQVAQQPVESHAAGLSEDVLERRLQELGLTEPQLEDTIVAGVEAFIERQQQAQMEAQRQQQAAASERLRPVSADEDFIRGAPDAEFSMIEYSDFECPFCKRFHETAISFERNNDNLNWVHRSFPLGSHNPQAQQAAAGALCVGDALGTDAYWEFNDRYYADTQSGGRGLPEQSVVDLMVAVGMDRSEAAACMESPEINAQVVADMRGGQEAGVTGTPGIFIRHNPTGRIVRVPGAVPLPDIQNRFDTFQAEL